MRKTENRFLRIGKYGTDFGDSRANSVLNICKKKKLGISDGWCWCDVLIYSQQISQ